MHILKSLFSDTVFLVWEHRYIFMLKMHQIIRESFHFLYAFSLFSLIWDIDSFDRIS